MLDGILPIQDSFCCPPVQSGTPPSIISCHHLENYRRLSAIPGYCHLVAPTLEMDGTVLPQFPKLSLHVSRDNVDPNEIVTAWLSKLQICFEERKFASLSESFLTDCWWRDMLGLSWDITTKRGFENISTYLHDSDVVMTDLKPSSGGLKPFLVEWSGDFWVQSAFSFQTKFGKGHGVLKLVNEPSGEWKVWTVYTELVQLHFQEELETRRIRGGAPLLHDRQANGDKVEPSVVIVGAGQAGISLAARLHAMGIRTRVVDRWARVGDSWRKRYETIMLNTPTFTDHYPFMKYPDNWPEWLNRDQTADFLEHYSQIMGLDVQLNTAVTSVRRVGSKYEVRVNGPHGEDVLYPDHVVLATGNYSDVPITPSFKNQGAFKGIIYHSIAHQSARNVPDVKTQRVVVIGSSTSGHDIAQDFVRCGAQEVSMVQRNPIFCLSRDTWRNLQLGLWNTPGLTTEEADLLGNSIPIALIRSMSIGLTRKMAKADREMLAGLRKAGLAIRTGEDGYGLADHQLITGGHYYIDQGACQMIIDGRIKVHQCEGGVQELGERSVILADGTSIAADVIVFATGYERNILTVRKLMGDDVADKLEGFGSFDHEQERKGWWRPTGIPGFWFMTGSFSWCRQFSRTLALQIAHAIKGGDMPLSNGNGHVD
ncbi:hypothetical protein JDV02_000129 [Purpureocillium takamizusanense]|uniref:Flavin-containing monooxygenase n=1 Tax=Purpureocillium takamizusanense TaxID=2060973 RepID=A0A9Q8Q5E7_9HYPO|nr:uncharacterized protein JDV02_000129 [Purpureocillium takamizusanense]UNI13380.1 hypothetical protein JDV02_000129 [Purpureocillium takamizusanense]